MLSVGVDIVDVSRIARACERWGERFLSRIYTQQELARYRDRVPELAVRFAAKEAISKALGTGMNHGVAWRQLEIAREPGQAPRLELHGAAAEHGERLGVACTWVSLAHDRHHAVATVILEGKG